jgi:hypothetical protein
MSKHLLRTLVVAAIAGILGAPVSYGSQLLRRMRRRPEMPARMPA